MRKFLKGSHEVLRAQGSLVNRCYRNPIIPHNIQLQPRATEPVATINTLASVPQIIPTAKRTSPANEADGNDTQDHYQCAPHDSLHITWLREVVLA